MAKSALQSELNKKHPFECAEQEACLNVVRTQDHLQTRFAQLFEQLGLSGTQYNVLRILRGHGEAVATQVIAGDMVTRTPDVTRLVDRLEQAGWVERQRTAVDRRVVLVKITRGGLDLLARLDRPVVDLHRQLLGHLSGAELTQLNRLLVKARQSPKSGCANLQHQADA